MVSDFHGWPGQSLVADQSIPYVFQVKNKEIHIQVGLETISLTRQHICESSNFTAF